MKAYPLLILSILVAGCASNPTAMEPKPAPDFRRPLQNTLYVEFLGDSQSIGLVAYANNPKWKCSALPAAADLRPSYRPYPSSIGAQTRCGAYPVRSL